MRTVGVVRVGQVIAMRTCLSGGYSRPVIAQYASDEAESSVHAVMFCGLTR